MKKITYFFLLVLMLISMTAKVFAATPKMNEPPFWMPCFEEFHDLQTFQKKYYIRHFVRKVEELKLAKSPSLNKMAEAAEWDVAWENIREKVYAACLNEKNLKACIDLAEVRLQTFEVEEETQFDR